MGGCEKVSLISIAILAENVSAILQAILVSYSIGQYCCLYYISIVNISDIDTYIAILTTLFTLLLSTLRQYCAGYRNLLHYATPIYLNMAAIGLTTSRCCFTFAPPPCISFLLTYLLTDLLFQGLRVNRSLTGERSTWNRRTAAGGLTPPRPAPFSLYHTHNRQMWCTN